MAGRALRLRLIERVQLRMAAAKLLRQHADPLRAAAQLAQEQTGTPWVPLHDAIAFVAIAKQVRKEVGSRNTGLGEASPLTLICPANKQKPYSRTVRTTAGITTKVTKFLHLCFCGNCTASAKVGSGKFSVSAQRLSQSLLSSRLSPSSTCQSLISFIARWPTSPGICKPRGQKLLLYGCNYPAERCACFVQQWSNVTFPAPFPKHTPTWCGDCRQTAPSVVLSHHPHDSAC
jgi:hypothetical protein